MNKIIFGLLGAIIASINSSVTASTSESVLSEDKPSYVNDYLDKEDVLNQHISPHLALEDKQRLANYEKHYLNEYQRLMQQQAPYQVSYVQPINKKKACKVWVVASSEFLKTTLLELKYFWDGACKNGYADGLGREFLVGGKYSRWALAHYQEGIPTYYAENDLFNKIYIEGIFDTNQLTWTGVETYFGDGFVMKQIGIKDYSTQIYLLEYVFSSRPGVRFLSKDYPNFVYKQKEYKLEPLSKVAYEFGIYDKNHKPNGWGLLKLKGETYHESFAYIDGKPKLTPLPNEFIQKYHYIMDEIHWAGQQALKAQKKALKVKQLYVRKYCSQPNQTLIKALPDYRDICNIDAN